MRDFERLTKSELEELRGVFFQLLRDEKALRLLEERERSAAKRGTTILRCLRKGFDEEALFEEKRMLQEAISQNGIWFSNRRAELERKISNIQDQYLRLVLSLHYIDQMTYKQAAGYIGNGATGDALQALVQRFFMKGEDGDDGAGA